MEKKFNWNWVLIPVLLVSVAATIYAGLTGNFPALLGFTGFNVTLLLLIGARGELKIADQMLNTKQNYITETNKILYETFRTADEQGELNRGLIEDLEGLGILIDAMSEYLVPEELMKINAATEKTGFYFKFDDGSAKYKVFVDKRKRVA